MDAENPLTTRTRYHVPAIERAVAVLELLAENRDDPTLSQIARELGIPKSSCLTILSTLESVGYVTRDARDVWSLTLRMYHIGMKRARSLDILTLARPVLQKLRDKTGLTTHLALADPQGAVYALKVNAPGLIQFDTYPGKRASLHLTAVGCLVAAYMSPEQRRSCLANYRFEGGAGSAISSRKAFAERLNDVCARGYAFEDGEEVAGVRCIAAPVLDHAGRIVAAVGITGLIEQVRDRCVPELALETISAGRALAETLDGQPMASRETGQVASPR